MSIINPELLVSRCDACGDPGPSGETRGQIVREMVLVGWDVTYDALDLHLCPICSEAGALPKVKASRVTVIDCCRP